MRDRGGSPDVLDDPSDPQIFTPSARCVNVIKQKNKVDCERSKFGKLSKVAQLAWPLFWSLKKKPKKILSGKAPLYESPVGCERLAGPLYAKLF